MVRNAVRERSMAKSKQNLEKELSNRLHTSTFKTQHSLPKRYGKPLSEIMCCSTNRKLTLVMHGSSYRHFWKSSWDTHRPRKQIKHKNMVRSKARKCSEAKLHKIWKHTLATIRSTLRSERFTACPNCKEILCLRKFNKNKLRTALSMHLLTYCHPRNNRQIYAHKAILNESIGTWLVWPIVSAAGRYRSKYRNIPYTPEAYRHIWDASQIVQTLCKVGFDTDFSKTNFDHLYWSIVWLTIISDKVFVNCAQATIKNKISNK